MQWQHGSKRMSFTSTGPKGRSFGAFYPTQGIKKGFKEVYGMLKSARNGLERSEAKRCEGIKWRG